MLNVVVLNGGRGAAALIPALLRQRGLNVTSVVNAYDDGKSTGQIRQFFGMLGPSDIRKVQELMLLEDDPEHSAAVHLFRYRFPVDCKREIVLAGLKTFANGSANELIGVSFSCQKVNLALRRFISEFLTGLSAIENARREVFSFADCSIMNCVYAGAFLVFNRNVEKATKYIDGLFRLKGSVLPTSIENKKLVALRENGEVLYSEAEIVELRSNVRIERIYLLDDALDRALFEALTSADKRYFLERHHCFVSVSPSVRLALQQADIIIYAAGTQHSSLYPTYLATGLAESISDNRTALKVFMTNIGADYETPQYKASDYIKGAYRYLCLSDGRRYGMQDFFDVMLINRSRFKADETYVELDEEGLAAIPVKVVVDQFESAHTPGKHDGDKVVQCMLTQYETATQIA